MTKGDAILVLLRDSRNERSNFASYRRVRRACNAIDLTEAETEVVMVFLEYHRKDGTLYLWLAKELEAKKEEK